LLVTCQPALRAKRPRWAADQHRLDRSNVGVISVRPLAEPILVVRARRLSVDMSLNSPEPTPRPV
jgi:hypothetical protein